MCLRVRMILYRMLSRVGEVFAKAQFPIPGLLPKA